MIDFMKIRTFCQTEIIRLRGLELIPDCPKQGWENYRLSDIDRIKLSFRPLFEAGELIGYCYADISIQPHFIFNNGKHNGNDFSTTQCTNTLKVVFESLNIADLSDFEVINLEFGVNVIPSTDVKEIVSAIYYWKRKPFRRNKADYSRITDSSTHKQIKAYAKGIDALERLKTDEVHPNTMRYEIKIKKQQQIKFSIWKNKYRERKFTAEELFKDSTYNRFQELIIQDLNLTLFLSKPKSMKGLNTKEKKTLRNLYNPKNWETFLTSPNRDCFNYNRKIYERISKKIPTIKQELQTLIEAKFQEWKNSAILPNKSFSTNEHNTLKKREINKNKFCNSTLTHTHARIL